MFLVLDKAYIKLLVSLRCLHLWVKLKQSSANLSFSKTNVAMADCPLIKKS